MVTGELKSKIDSLSFLAWYFKSPKFKQLMVSEVTGIGGSLTRAQPKAVAEYPVPILPMEEQNEIAIILDKAANIILSRKQQLSALDDLIKARFVEMFGDETNPYQWPVVNVEDVANVSVGVVIKPAQYYTDAEHGVKAFRSLNIGAGTIKDSDWVYFSHEGNDKNSKSQLRENDLLIVRSGAPGTACVVPKVYEGCNAIDSGGSSRRLPNCFRPFLQRWFSYDFSFSLGQILTLNMTQVGMDRGKISRKTVTISEGSNLFCLNLFFDCIV